MRIARRHGRPFVARGAGTGLAGGAMPLDDAVVIVTTQMNRVLVVDADARVGVGRARRAQPRPHRARSRTSGCTSRPTRRSQQACTIGGNVATNAGGPHCLAVRRHQRRTSSPSRSCCPTARSRCSAALEPEPAGLRPARRVRRQRGHAGHRHPDRGAAHAEPAGGAHAAARLRRRSTTPPRRSAAIIAAGIVPAALEMMDAAHHRARSRTSCTPASRATPPRCCSSRSTACRRRSAADVDAVARDRPRRTAPARCASPPTRPSGRCCGRAASRRSARSPASRPTTTCTTPSCPRTQLVEVLRAGLRDRRPRTTCIVMNVFHAGDGNLHPLLVFDQREPGVMERVHAAGDEILAASRRGRRRAVGRARHRAREARLHAAACSAPTTSTPRRALRDAFDPDGARQPAARCCRAGSRCGDLQRVPGGRVDLMTALDAFADRRSAPTRRRSSPSAVARSGTSAAPSTPCAREVRAPAGIVAYEPDGDDGARAARARPSPSSTPRSAERGPVRRAARADGRPSAACSPSGAAASAGSATGPCATRCSRSAS